MDGFFLFYLRNGSIYSNYILFYIPDDTMLIIYFVTYKFNSNNIISKINWVLTNKLSFIIRKTTAGL